MARPSPSPRRPPFGARLAARLYDPLLEPLVGRFRDAGVELAPGRPGARVLDVGCGTGSHLARYAEAGAVVAGVDLNPAMLAAARRRLGPQAHLVLGSGESLPFPEGSFDLALTMTVLHAVEADAAARILAEMARVTAADGRVLVIDHHPEQPAGWRGRLIRGFTSLIERVAGADHYRSFRRFVAGGGVAVPAAAAGLEIAARSVEASGTMGLYLLQPKA